MKKVNIGLLGFGNVGAGTYETLYMNKSHIEKEAKVDIQVKKILVNSLDKPRLVEAPQELFTTNADDILLDKDIDIVVEVLGGVEPAASYMKKALENGKHVVTANKAAAADQFEDLVSLAEKNKLTIKFEGCVAGGIPILNAITTVLKANQFDEILGILNGTTNYILTKMADEGLSYDNVLKDAQEKGFAEADPTADVDGIDAANKLSLLMALSMGKYVHPSQIPTVGIRNVTLEDIEKAQQDNKTIKLIAEAKIKDGQLDYSVKPMALDNEHPLARVKNEFNAVFVKGNAVDELMFYGRGAGSLPTGSAVAGDVLRTAQIIASHRR